MKPRRVTLTIEVDTDIPIKDLKEVAKVLEGTHSGFLEVIQVQANVVQKK